jgi:hypothetical protein
MHSECMCLVERLLPNCEFLNVGRAGVAPFLRGLGTLVVHRRQHPACRREPVHELALLDKLDRQLAVAVHMRTPLEQLRELLDGRGNRQLGGGLRGDGFKHVHVQVGIEVETANRPRRRRRRQRCNGPFTSGLGAGLWSLEMSVAVGASASFRAMEAWARTVDGGAPPTRHATNCWIGVGWRRRLWKPWGDGTSANAEEAVSVSLAVGATARVFAAAVSSSTTASASRTRRSSFGDSCWTALTWQSARSFSSRRSRGAGEVVGSMMLTSGGEQQKDEVKR